MRPAFPDVPEKVGDEDGCDGDRSCGVHLLISVLSTSRWQRRQPRRAASIAATSIFCMVIIAAKARSASAPPAAIASVSVRGVIRQLTPHLSLHLNRPGFPRE